MGEAKIIRVGVNRCRFPLSGALAGGCRYRGRKGLRLGLAEARLTDPAMDR